MLYIANRLRWSGCSNLLENIHGCMVILYGQTLLHRLLIFHWKSFTITNRSVKTKKLFHLEQFAIFGNLVYAYIKYIISRTNKCLVRSVSSYDVIWHVLFVELDSANKQYCEKLQAHENSPNALFTAGWKVEELKQLVDHFQNAIFSVTSVNSTIILLIMLLI